MFEYIPKNVCAKKISIEVIEDKIQSVVFFAGCSGNLQAVGRLVEGMSIEEAIHRLEGIECDGRPTSCPDQLSKALRAYQSQSGDVYNPPSGF